jgi:hypothetical protein
MLIQFPVRQISSIEPLSNIATSFKPFIKMGIPAAQSDRLGRWRSSRARPADLGSAQNWERMEHDHLRSYKCSNCKKASQFVRLSDAPTLWLTPETQSRKIDSNN